MKNKQKTNNWITASLVRSQGPASKNDEEQSGKSFENYNKTCHESSAESMTDRQGILKECKCSALVFLRLSKIGCVH